MPDVAESICETCRGGRYCAECLGWSDREIPCTFCDNTGSCSACDGTGERQDDDDG